MIRLDPFEQELFENAYQGQRWMYQPRIQGQAYGLAIAVVGRPGKINVPLECCSTDSFDQIRSHVDQLNASRLPRAA